MDVVILWNQVEAVSSLTLSESLQPSFRAKLPTVPVANSRISGALLRSMEQTEAMVYHQGSA